MRAPKADDRRSIRLLDEETVAGISAGEVIERPASVVKELVENAIDAGATRVRIEIEGSGMKLIRVSDNGRGIPSTEVALAFARHATSKLAALDDLLRVSTFGFRGEALAAIAAAGRIEMKTRVDGAREGASAKGGPGGEMEVRPVGCEKGTSIAVRNLFGEMPARLKFLKSPAAESSAIARAVEPYAMTNLKVHFTLSFDGEERMNAPATDDELARLKAVIGAGDVEFLSLERSSEGMSVRGYVESPGTVRRRGRMMLQVNGRPVEDRSLRHAVISAYSGQLPRETQPWAAIFVTVPPAEVDVNVHPTKAEVRFSNAQAVYRVVHEGVKRCFGLSGQAPGTQARMLPDRDSAAIAGEPQTLGDWATAAPASAVEGPEVIAQLYRTYIVSRCPDGLFLVDQHTAHEKILYERLQDRDRGNFSQGLLVPQKVELSASEFALLNDHGETLRRLGIEYDGFGGRSIVIQAVPAQATDRDLGSMLRWLFEDLEAAGRAPSREEIEKKLVATMACHLAVKSGDALTRPEMERIMNELLALKDPRTCPHGRPTFVKFEEGDLARMFRRTWGLGKRECH